MNSVISYGNSYVRFKNILTQLICILATFALTLSTTPLPPQNDYFCHHDSFIFSFWPSVSDSTVLPLTFYIRGLFYWLHICNLTRLSEVYSSILPVNKQVIFGNKTWLCWFHYFITNYVVTSGQWYKWWYLLPYINLVYFFKIPLIICAVYKMTIKNIKNNWVFWQLLWL